MAVPFRHIAATVLVAGCLTAPARAQRPEERPVTIYSDVLSGRGEYATVVLAGGTAYRVELIPGTAVLSVRTFQLGGRPPMITRATEDQVASAGGATWLVVPAESGEYRIEVAANEAVRVRIIRDPREQALLEGRAPTAWHMLALGARWVTLPGAWPVSDADTLHDLNGWELCVGVVEGSIPWARRLSGCAFTYARLESSEGWRYGFYGVAPRYALARGPIVALDLAAGLAFGREVETLSLGLNARTTGTGFVAFEVEPGVAWMRRDGTADPGGFTEHPALTTILPRLAAGVRIHF